jgi:hypothetical protein
MAIVPAYIVHKMNGVGINVEKSIANVIRGCLHDNSVRNQDCGMGRSTLSSPILARTASKYC